MSRQQGVLPHHPIHAIQMKPPLRLGLPRGVTLPSPQTELPSPKSSGHGTEDLA